MGDMWWTRSLRKKLKKSTEANEESLLVIRRQRSWITLLLFAWFITLLSGFALFYSLRYLPMDVTPAKVDFGSLYPRGFGR